MQDQEENSEEVEVAPPETETDESNIEAESNEDVQPEPEEDPQERNWRNMRQRQKELELEIQRRDQLLDRVLQAQPKEKPVAEEEPEVPDDEYVPAGSVRKIASKSVKPLEDKIAELESRLAQQDQQKRLNDLRGKYSDFDDVVNLETLELFEQQEPELAKDISELKDPYKIGLHSYRHIKAMGLTDKLSTSRRKKEVDQKLEKNKKTVQTPQAYEKRPIAQAMRSTQADSKRLYEEMMQYASQATGF